MSVARSRALTRKLRWNSERARPVEMSVARSRALTQQTYAFIDPIIVVEMSVARSRALTLLLYRSYADLRSCRDACRPQKSFPPDIRPSPRRADVFFEASERNAHPRTAHLHLNVKLTNSQITSGTNRKVHLLIRFRVKILKKRDQPQVADLLILQFYRIV